MLNNSDVYNHKIVVEELVWTFSGVLTLLQVLASIC